MNIIILGGSGSIGSAILKEYSKDSKNSIFISSTKPDSLNQLKKKYKCSGKILDVRDNNSIESFFKDSMNNLESVDAVINCVGSILLKPMHLAKESEIIDTFYINTIQSALTIKYSIPLMKKMGVL